MHIGIDARFWSETGVGRYTRNLISQLEKIDQKNDYTLFILEKDFRDIKFQISNLKFKIKVVNIHWHTLTEQFAFPKVLDGANLDLMHFPYFSVPIFYKKPFIITIHDLILHHFPTGEASTLPQPVYKIKHAGYKYIIQKAAQNAEKIIAVSQATKDEIVKHLGVSKDKVSVIYEGVDKSLINRPIFAEKKNQILHVGNLYPHKNMSRVLEALRMCLDQKVNIKLVIVGKKDFFYQKFYNKVQIMGLSESVVFKGEVSDAELASLYNTSTATIVPSLMEGFGLPALEAMSNNCLVLASNTPSLKEVCQDAAIYFEPLDSTDIAEKIHHTLSLSSKDRNTRTKIGYNRAQQFSWLNMGKLTLGVYESCAGIRQSK